MLNIVSAHPSVIVELSVDCRERRVCLRKGKCCRWCDVGTGGRRLFRHPFSSSKKQNRKKPHEKWDGRFRNELHGTKPNEMVTLVATIGGVSNGLLLQHFNASFGEFFSATIIVKRIRKREIMKHGVLLLHNHYCGTRP